MRRSPWSDIAVFLVALALCVGVGVVAPDLFISSRPNINPAVAAHTLKTEILPAEILFQNACYRDDNRNHIGECGSLAELCGQVPVAGSTGPTTLALLNDRYQTPTPNLSGYCFVIYLPDGPATARTDPGTTTPDAKTSAMRETHWRAYAWPADPNQGRRMFAIDATGIVYEHAYAFANPATAPAPAWNALTTDDPTPEQPHPAPGTWLSPVSPDWLPYRPRH
jgi:hypothetical protein